MKQDDIGYYRCRERAEREAVRNAVCAKARWAHQQMAAAYARLVEIEQLQALGSVAAGKVITRAQALRARENAEYGRRAAI